MLIAYASRTGNVRRFVAKLELPLLQVEEEATALEPFVLVTYTTGFGEAPDRVLAFLRRNHRYLRGVAASGNRNWGDNFARSADRIAELYGVPVVGKFELAGTRLDVQHILREVNAVAVC